MGVTIRGTGGRSTVSLTALSVFAGTECTRLVDDLTNRIKLTAQGRCPVRTGKLRASHETTITQEAMRVVGTVDATAEYAAAVHDGAIMRNGRKRRGNPWLANSAKGVASPAGWKFTSAARM